MKYIPYFLILNLFKDKELLPDLGIIYELTLNPVVKSLIDQLAVEWKKSSEERNSRYSGVVSDDITLGEGLENFLFQ